VQTQKKIKQTDAIFAKLKVVNTAADETKTVLRVSWDAKTAVKIGDFACVVARIVWHAKERIMISNRKRF